MAEFRTIPGRNCYRHINRDEKGKEKEKEEEEEEEKERKKNVFILGHFLGRKSRNNCPENPLLISINAREMDNGERVGVLQVISGAQTRWQHMAPLPPPPHVQLARKTALANQRPGREIPRWRGDDHPITRSPALQVGGVG